jgi:1-acyl-sn-glycerol-3-phosphate acyltransferase
VNLRSLTTSAAAFSGFYLEGLYCRLTRRGHSRWHECARRWGRFMLRAAGVSVSVEGEEHIEPGRPYLVVANHQSYADTPVMMGYLPLDFRFLAKASLFRVPVIGAHLRHAGHVPVDRADARASLSALNRGAAILRDLKTSVLIFAEGTRSHGDAMQEFRAGAAHLAIQTQATVLPVAIAGSARTLPKDTLSLRPGAVQLRIGEPIPAAGLTRKDRGAFTAALRERIHALLS